MLKQMYAFLLLAGLTAVSVQAAEIDTKEAACPVAKGKGVNPAQSVEYQGGKVFFCCGNCKAAFEKDPAKFAAKANHQLVATKQATQKSCPLTGGKMNDSRTVTVNKVDVSLCCGNCQKKVTDQTAEEQINTLFSAASFKKGFKVNK